MLIAVTHTFNRRFAAACPPAHPNPAPLPLQYVAGEVTLRDGDYVTDLDVRLPFEGIFVPRTGARCAQPPLDDVSFHTPTLLR